MRHLALQGFAALLALLSACTFSLDRELGDGEIRAVLGVRGDKGFEPLAGARLQLVGARISATSDAEGRVVLRAVPASKWDARAVAGEGEGERRLLLRGIEVKALGGGRIEGVDLGKLTLEAVGAIEGRVVKGAEGVAKAIVAVVDGASVAVAEDGSFRLGRLAPGEYAVAVQLTTPGEAASFGTLAVKVEAGKVTTVTLDVETLPALRDGKVTGSVQTFDGDWANVRVTFDPLAGGAPIATGSDADGLYAIDVPGGTYRVSARRDGTSGVVIDPVVVNGDLALPLLFLGDPKDAQGDLDGDELPDPKSLELTPPATPVRAGESALFTVTARDASGAVASGYRGSVAVTSDDPAAAKLGEFSLGLVEQGTRTIPITLKTPGKRRVTITDTARAAFTATLEQLDVVAIEPVAIRLTPPSSVTAGEAFQLHMEVIDAEGKVVPTFVGTLLIAAQGNRVVVEPSVELTGSDAGAVDVDVVAFGTGDVRFSVRGEENEALTGSAEFKVVPGPFGNLVLEVPSDVENDVAFPIVVTAHDGQENVVEDFTGRVVVAFADAVGAITPAFHEFTIADKGRFEFSGVVTANAGSKVIATSGAISNEAAFSVTYTPAFSLHLVAPLVTDTLDAGQAIPVTVEVRNRAGARHTTFAGEVTVESDDPDAPIERLSFVAADAGRKSGTLRGVRTLAPRVFLRSGDVSSSVDLTLRPAAITVQNLAVRSPDSECQVVEADVGPASGRLANVTGTWTLAGDVNARPMRLLSTRANGLSGVPLAGSDPRRLSFEWDALADGVPTGVPVTVKLAGKDAATGIGNDATVPFTLAPAPARAAGALTVSDGDDGAIFLADLDGDRTPELISTTSMGLRVRKGLVDGGFATSANDVLLNAIGRSVSAGNVIGDSKVDTIVATAEPPGFSIIVGNGTPGGGSVRDVIVGTEGGVLPPAVADFNRDGRDDLVTVKLLDRELRVLHGTRGTTISTNQTAIVGASPTALGAADLDRDGWLDLVISHATTSALSVLFGGTNGLGQPVVITGTAANDVVLADFDQDGIVDLATANASGTGVMFRKGTGARGTGIFAAETSLGAAVAVERLSLARWTRDVAPELVAWKANEAPTVFTRVGAAPVVIALAEAARAVAVGDLDGDGLDDLVSATGTDLKTRVSGSSKPCRRLPAAHPIVAPTDPSSVAAAADLNGDGRVDLVTGSADPAGVEAHLSAGEGVFTSEWLHDLDTAARMLRLADATGDGVADLFVVRAPSTAFELYRGLGDGTFDSTPVSTAVPGGIDLLAAGDVNRDGLLDVVTARYSDGSITLWSASQAGAFTSLYTRSIGRPIVRFALEDVDRDGWRDALLLDAAGSKVVMRSGRDGWTSERELAFDSTPRMLLAGALDVNDDGARDVGVLLADDSLRVVSFASAPAQLDLLPLSGAPTHGGFGLTRDRKPMAWVSGGTDAAVVSVEFSPRRTQVVARGLAGSLVVADLDGDGASDAVSIEPQLGLRIVRANGAATASIASMADARTLTTGDWDRDGRIDLIAGDGQNTSAALFRGGGNGAFQPRTTLFGGSSNGVGAAPAMLSDLDADGWPDIFLGHTAIAGASLAWGAGAAGVATGVDRTNGERVLAIGQPVRTADAVDLDADGRLDVAIFGESDGRAHFARNLGARQWSVASPLALPSSTRAVSFGDFDGDGLADVAVGQSDPKGFALLRGLGGGSFETPVLTPLAASVVAFGAVRDYTGDGTPDLVAYGEDGALSLSYAAANGRTTTTRRIPTGCTVLRAGDTDGDALPEILAFCPAARALVRVPVGAGGPFGVPELFGLAGSTVAAAIADFDGDGVDDVVAASSEGGGQVLRAR